MHMQRTKFFGINIFLMLLFLLNGCSGGQMSEELSDSEQENVTEESVSVQDQEVLTPEEVLERMDAEEGIGVEQGPVTVTIVSPKEEKFMQSQARMYKAEIDGMAQGMRCVCHWSFYLNQYDTEELYREQDTPCTPDWCGFTSTFIDSRGDLRVTVDVDVMNNKREVQQTGTAEANYRVE